MRSIPLGATDQSTVIRFINNSDGLPIETFDHTTAGLSLWYRRSGAAQVAITPVSLATPGSAHVDGGFLHIGAGYYRLDLPDAACAAGTSELLVGGAESSAILIAACHPLVAYNPQDGVRLGLTSLPTAPPASTGGLPTVDGNNHVAGMQGTKNQFDDLHDISTTEVGLEVEAGLVDYDAATADELAAAFTEIKGADWNSDNDSLIKIRQRGDAAWLTADISSLSTFDPATDAVDVGTVAGVAITGPNDLKADVSGLSTFDATTTAVNVGKVAGSSVAGVNDFKANLSTLATATEQAALKELLEADRYIDTTTTPWNLVLIKKGTGNLASGTELLRQQLKDTTAGNITDTTSVIGSSVSA